MKLKFEILNHYQFNILQAKYLKYKILNNFKMNIVESDEKNFKFEMNGYEMLSKITTKNCINNTTDFEINDDYYDNMMDKKIKKFYSKNKKLLPSVSFEKN